jgi:ligand-binding sensor domain-containing protein
VIALLAVAAVYTDVGEARACLPLDHGALVGTGGGLVKLDDDGAIGRVWTALDGLPGTRIESLAELGGQIWIGTDGGGARVAGEGFAEAFTSRDVRGFARLGDRVYAATWDGGVIDVHGGAALSFRDAPLKGPRARVAGLAVVDGTLYAGTAAGLFALVHGKLERVPVDGVTSVAGLYAHEHTLWLATADGLVARTGATVQHLGGGDLRAIAQIGDDLVVAGIADGLQKVDRGRLVAYAGPRGLRIAESLAAAHGAVCTGGLAGAWLSRGTTWVHAAHREGPPSNDISALAVDGARLYVGTFDHGLATFEHGAWRTVESPELDARINAILVDGDKLWVGTAEGLTILGGPGFRDAARLTRRDGLASRSVLSLAKASTGILVGTSQGASLFADGHPVRLGPKAPAGAGQTIESIGNVWAVAEDRAGWLWLGTTTGLYRGHAGDTAWQRFSVVTGHLHDDWVIAMAMTGDALYVGTYNGGIVRFDGTTATHVADGWVNPGGLAVIGERIYAATQDGLRVTDDGTHWTDAGALPGRDTTAIARVDGTLIAGTRRGLAVLRR